MPPKPAPIASTKATPEGDSVKLRGDLTRGKKVATPTGAQMNQYPGSRRKKTGAVATFRLWVTTGGQVPKGWAPRQPLYA